MRWPRWFRRARRHAESGQEIQFYLDQETEDNVARGMPPDEARSAARKKLGNPGLIQEEIYRMHSAAFFETIGKDLRFALRTMRKNPAFAATAVLTLALGIGANTAIFSAIDAVMLRTIAVERPHELVQVQQWLPEYNPGWAWAIFTYSDFTLFRDNNQVFADMAAASRRIANARIGADPEAGKGAYVSANFYSMLGVRPYIGSLAIDWSTAVLDYRFWERVYGGDPSVIGRALVVDDKSYTIAGVAALGFDGIDAGEPLDFTVPIEVSGTSAVSHGQFGPNSPWLQIVARLKPGRSISQAAANLNVIYAPIFADRVAQFAAQHRHAPIDWITVRSAASGISRVRDDYSRAFLILIAVAGAVLLIACVNVTNLLLARSAARTREFGVRLCLGAGRARVVSQIMTESLTLCLAGGIAGMMLARWIGASLAGMLASGRQTVELDLHLDARVLVFTFALTTFATIIVGLVPALGATRVSPNDLTRRTSPFQGSRWIRIGFLVAQVAVSLVLVAGAGLFLATLRNLETLDAGFRRDHIVLATIQPEKAGYDGARRNEFYREFLDRLRQSFGVRSASLSLIAPMIGMSLAVPIQIEGYAPQPEEQMAVALNEISAHYFETTGTPIIAGRDFDAHDDDPATPRVLINESVARRFFKDTNPLGRIITFRANVSHRAEIIGVVGDAKYANMRGHAPLTMYANLLQTDARMAPWVEVYASDDAHAAAALRQTITAVNPNVPLTGLTTFNRQIQASLVSERLMATITAIFGALALLMAAIGLYGVLAYSVTQRTREIGIRMALGAQRGRVISMVMRGMAVTLVGGLALGTAVALALGRFVASMLYDVKPHDPWTLAVAIGLLSAAAALAAYLPARRASHVDPMIALRYE